MQSFKVTNLLIAALWLQSAALWLQSAALWLQSLQIATSNKPNTFELQPKPNLSSHLSGCNLKVFTLFEVAIEDIEMKGLQLTKWPL